MRNRNKILLFFVFVVFVLILISTSLCKSTDNKTISKSEDSGKAEIKQQKQPMIIWAYSCYRDKPESLKYVLESGLVNYVFIKASHRRDFGDHKNKMEVQQAIKMVKRSHAKLIWCRNLWPQNDVSGIKPATIFDTNYYVNEIKILFKEENEIGADYVALDTEAYGKVSVSRYLKGKDRIEFKEKQYEQLKAMVDSVVEKVGQVDFLAPGGHIPFRHPHNIIAVLGKNRITQTTFYSRKKRSKTRAPYEIFGMYVNTTAEHEKYHDKSYYLISEVFEKSELWSDKKGVFIWPRENKALDIAKKLKKYSETLPRE